MADVAQGKTCPACGTLTAVSGSYTDQQLSGQCAACGAAVTQENFSYTRPAGYVPMALVDVAGQHPDGMLYPSYQDHQAAYERGVQAVAPNPADYPNTYAAPASVAITSSTANVTAVTVDAGNAFFATVDASNSHGGVVPPEPDSERLDVLETVPTESTQQVPEHADVLTEEPALVDEPEAEETNEETSAHDESQNDG